MKTSIRARLAFVSSAALVTAVLAGCGVAQGGSAEHGSGDDSEVEASSLSGSLEEDYAGTFEAPPTSGPHPEPGVNVWAITCSSQSPACQGAAEATREAGEELGWEITIADGKAGVGDAYNTAIRQAVAGGAKAIISIGIDCDYAKGAFQAAKEAGIATVAVQALDCADHPLFSATLKLSEEYPDFAAWLQAWGAAKARWLVEATDGEAQVINMDIRGSAAVHNVVKGFNAELAKCDGCKVVATVDSAGTDYATGVVAQAFASTLAAHPEANAINPIYDSTLVIANIPSAVASSGRKLTIVGGEAIQPGLSFLRNGQVDAEIGYDMSWAGWAAVDTVVRALAGEPAAPAGMGWQTLDADHLPPADMKSYQANVDYRAAYRKAWGVAQ